MLGLRCYIPFRTLRDRDEDGNAGIVPSQAGLVAVLQVRKRDVPSSSADRSGVVELGYAR
jgi:hypothetical protein